jgi:hypothetical protein
MWVNMIDHGTSLSTLGTILNRITTSGGGSGPTETVRFDPVNQVFSYTAQGKTVRSSMTADAIDNAVWYLITAWWNSSSQNPFIKVMKTGVGDITGTLIASGTLNTTAATTALRVGAVHLATEGGGIATQFPLNGWVDEIKLFNHILTDSEIAEAFYVASPAVAAPRLKIKTPCQPSF